MANMQNVRTLMGDQDPVNRTKNFKEVALGYSTGAAMNEADRCLNCVNRPCVSGCPVGIPIPDFLRKVADGDINGAYEILSAANALPSISGRVAPRRPSVRANASGESRASPSPSAESNAL